MWFSKKKEKGYKFKSLKTYAWDKTISNKRKYRTVFDTHELNYLSVALELYNKYFDEKDWTLEVTFSAYSIENGELTTLHCNTTKSFEIAKDQNIVLCDYGWGNDEKGSYWKKGDYIWQVFIDEELIDSVKFRIEDMGLVTIEDNPYFTITSVKTYETDGSEKNDNRIYLKQFLYKHSHYIMTEVTFISHVPNEWLCELFFNYYDDSGLLIGISDALEFITPENGADEEFSITRGWGSENPTLWLPDNYRVEIIFMDTLVAVIPFSIGDEVKARSSFEEVLINSRLNYLLNPEVDENAEVLYKENIENSKIEEEEIKKEEEIKNEENTSIEKEEKELHIEELEEDLETTLQKLNNLVGLNSIKEKINEHIDYVTYLQLRLDKGIVDEDIHLHSVFTGNPGTGKTTVVKLLGSIYRNLGLLSRGHVVTVESNDLVSGYVRQTGENTAKIIEKARGGILFIDEAYMLFKEGATNDFGPEAIAVLLTEMSDGNGDIAIMLAGYPKEMESLLNSNPGLKSRFKNYYHFPDYLPEELLSIAKYAALKHKVSISNKAIDKLQKIISDAYRKRDFTFGNARFVHSIIEEAKINLGVRVVRNYDPDDITKKVLSEILDEDIEDISTDYEKVTVDFEIDHELLNEALEDINNLIGIENIKREIQELIKLSKYYREINRDVINAISMHAVFSGNPGTGKTTVARILGKVYKALGLLERGHIVEADASSLIAGYVGQSAIKTKDLITKAMGGILFIDEAYSITDHSPNSNSSDFGKKAIAALLKEMEDHRGKFGVIVAGYTQNMIEFLNSNPGLKSRFDKTFVFKDFNEEQLWEILKIKLIQKGLKPDKKATVALKEHINRLYSNRNKFFGNARSMRKIVEHVYRNHELRMADMPKNQRTKKVIETLEEIDVRDFELQEIVSSERILIGFKKQ